ncbi:hypothetical protein F511_29734 [Dorcoceras hygrometricum]|uniref:Uncharacterized protein n=1 Tax=Dorcoceras hygrometricum TaxID=472368 RepID=A0A2Z7BZU1_9LAMI|nr:hypothetical protein F511_29734 [Dorcoceras hygrometricum]
MFKLCFGSNYSPRAILEVVVFCVKAGFCGESLSVINPAVACFSARFLDAVVLVKSGCAVLTLSRDLVASVPTGCPVEAYVNAGQHHCSARRKLRRLDVATGCPAARDLCATVARVWFPVACNWYCARAIDQI